MRADRSREVDELDGRAAIAPRRRRAHGAHRSFATLLDVDADGLAGPVIDSEDVQVGQSDETLAHARSVGVHRGSGALGWCRNPRFFGPL